MTSLFYTIYDVMILGHEKFTSMSMVFVLLLSSLYGLTLHLGSLCFLLIPVSRIRLAQVFAVFFRPMSTPNELMLSLFLLLVLNSVADFYS